MAFFIYKLYIIFIYLTPKKSLKNAKKSLNLNLQALLKIIYLSKK